MFFNLFGPYFFKQNFKNSFLNLFAPLCVKIYLLILVAINFLLWLGAHYLDFQADNNLLILHYNVGFGIDLIGGGERLYIVPALGLAIILMNLILLAGLAGRKDIKFITHLLLASALFANAILLVSLGTVYLINFR